MTTKPNSCTETHTLIECSNHFHEQTGGDPKAMFLWLTAIYGAMLGPSCSVRIQSGQLVFPDMDLLHTHIPGYPHTFQEWQDMLYEHFLFHVRKLINGRQTLTEDVYETSTHMTNMHLKGAEKLFKNANAEDELRWDQWSRNPDNSSKDKTIYQTPKTEKAAAELKAQKKKTALLTLTARPLVTMEHLNASLIERFGRVTSDGHLLVKGRARKALWKVLRKTKERPLLQEALYADPENRRDDLTLLSGDLEFDALFISLQLEVETAELPKLFPADESDMAVDRGLLLIDPTQATTNTLKPLPEMVEYFKLAGSTLYKWRFESDSILVKLSAEAQDMHSKYCQEMEVRAKEPGPGWKSRLLTAVPFYSLKTALVWTVLANQDIIGVETYTEAKKLIEHHLSLQMVKLASTGNTPDIGDQEHMQKIIAKVEKFGPLTRRQLYRKFKRQAKAEHNPSIEQALIVGDIVEEDGVLSHKAKIVSPSQSSAGVA